MSLLFSPLALVTLSFNVSIFLEHISILSMNGSIWLPKTKMTIAIMKIFQYLKSQ